MRKLLSILLLGFGFVLFGVSAIRLGLHASAIRRTENDQARDGALEDAIASQNAIINAATDPSLTNPPVGSAEARIRASARIQEAIRQRGLAMLELGSHSSKAAADELDNLYFRRTIDDRGLEFSLVLLIAGLVTAPTRKTNPLAAGQSAS
jgi:hypothetical protein